MQLTITKKIGLVLLFPLCAALFSLMIFYSFLSDTAENSKFATIVSSQRALIPQLQSDSHMVAQMGHEEFRQHLQKNITEFEQLLTFLEKGGYIKGYKLPVAPVDLSEQVANIKRVWLEQKQFLLVIVENKGRTTNVLQALEYVEDNIHHLNQAADELMSALEFRREVLQQRLLVILVLIAGFDLVLLVAGIWVLNRYVKERRQTMEVLREREAGLANAQRIAHFGNWDWDIINNKLRWSDEVYRIFGFKPHDFKENYEDFIRVVHPDDKDLVASAINAALYKEKEYSIDHRIILPDGAERIVHEEAEVIFNEAGTPIHMSGTVHDVTERMQIEEGLRILVEGVSDVTGNDFFRMLVKSLAQILGVHRAMVAEVTEDTLKIRTIAVCTDGEIVDNFEYAMAGTPCQIVFDDAFCYYATDIQQQFPEYNKSFGLGVGSYLGVPLYTSSGDVIGVVAVIDGKPLANIEFASSMLQLVAIRSAAELERTHAEKAWQSFEEIVAKSVDGILVIDESGVIQHANPAASKLLDQNQKTMIGTVFGYKTIPGVASEVVIICADGSKGIAEMQVVETQWHDNQAYLALLRDITERKRAEQRLDQLAHFDDLTGAPNRALFFDRLNQALSRTHWHDRLVAVLFIDLDRFKQINDTLGHDVGDALLQEASARLISCVRDGDTVARIGGDEFAVILIDVAQENDIPIISQKILEALDRPFIQQGHELFVTASIGISLHPNDAEDAQTLVRFADIAMYRAKEQGRNNYQFYSPALNAKAPERLALETHLRQALARDEFELHYQPKVDLVTGQVTGMEALLRWNHPEHGAVSPMEFIPLLEETGLIVPVGEWVLRTACIQTKSWQESGFPPLRVAVNLSARQFKQQDLANKVLDILQETGLEARYLELELTESILMERQEETIALLHILNATGIHISVDDFGTGYSSLSYLKRFPINALKIDRSFVKDIIADHDDAAIAKAVIAMAHSLKLKVIAEGVETQEQLAFLCSNDCDEMQGYYFSRPLATDAFSQLMKEGRYLDISASHQKAM